MKAPFVIGRMIFGGLFFTAGVNHLRHRKEMKPYVESKGLPKPELLVTLSVVPLLLGGASLILGVKPKLGALTVLGFLGGVSPLMHDFWSTENPQERQQSMADFMKNIGLAGAALALMSTEQPKLKIRSLSQPSLLDTVRDITSEIAA
jgi:putative oxidoreductase